MIFILMPIFFLIAVLYSMAGLGGGTAYITAMVLFGVPKEVFPPIALGCNLLVASQGFYRFHKAGHFKWRLFWPFAITSIPCAYLGGRIALPDKAFLTIMVVALTLAAIRMIFWINRGHTLNSELSVCPRFIEGNPPKQENYGIYRTIASLVIGCVLGLIAGLTGIGGGIYLIPVLIFLGWAGAKEAAAVGSLFILVNSVSGLFGQLQKGHFDLKLFIPLAVVVIMGGYIGSKAGANKLKAATLQKIVGIIMMIAAMKLAGNLFK